jgi:hypothetical protein
MAALEAGAIGTTRSASATGAIGRLAADSGGGGAERATGRLSSGLRTAPPPRRKTCV